VLSQPVTDEDLDFFSTLVLHTRMGFYGDIAYGGNRDQVGWRTIGFPGPASLADTHGRYSTMDYMEEVEYWQHGSSHQE
jgi:gluconate 2-dehydrogenase gamma chain